MAKEFPKTLSQVTVLEYYDGPLLFVALDAIGTRYLCVFLETKDTGSEYLCIPISLARLNSFKIGNRDLRSNYEEPEIPEYYKILTNSDDSETLTATPISPEEVDPELLPESGYYLSEPELRAEVEAESMHSLVEVSLDVRGSKNYPVIRTYTLSDLLRGFQDTMKYAARGLSRNGRQKETKNLFSETEVYGFSLSSFTVKLRSSIATGEMFQLGIFNQAAAMVTDLLRLVSTDADRAIDFLRDNKGHFVSAVKRLLTVAVDEGCGFSVGWRPSGAGEFRRVTVSFNQAHELKSLLSVQSELEVDEAVYTGIFIALSIDRWRFRLENGDEIHGVVDPNQPHQLSGITYESAKYTIRCSEQLIVDKIDRERMHRILKTFEFIQTIEPTS